MDKKKNKALLSAAVAGLMGAALMAVPAAAKKAPKLVHCYGVNKCKGHASCMGKGHMCAGKNSCKGQGWLAMPAKSCENIEGGSLKPVKKMSMPMKKMSGQ